MYAQNYSDPRPISRRGRLEAMRKGLPFGRPFLACPPAPYLAHSVFVAIFEPSTWKMGDTPIPR
jgi:hypothetical protein